MRSTYLLFILAIMGLAALVYQITQPQRLSPQAERLIREAVAEAVAAEFRERTATQNAPVQDQSDLDAYVEHLVRERVEAELQKQESQAVPQPRDGATGDAVALLEARRESEVRLRDLRRASTDALIEDAVRIASDVQAWKLKPAPFGGGADQDGFTGLTFEATGYPQDEAGFFTSLHGRFRLDARRDTAYVIGTNPEHGIRVVVTVSGVKPSDVRSRIEAVPAEE
ncbi:MAG: hypothetical protein R3247_08500 [Rhodothermales bacterium]|nr:hypothetical protein [Rhodothermales bacterium]